MDAALPPAARHFHQYPRELHGDAPLFAALAIVLRAAHATICALHADDPVRAELLEIYTKARAAFRARGGEAT